MEPDETGGGVTAVDSETLQGNGPTAGAATPVGGEPVPGTVAHRRPEPALAEGGRVGRYVVRRLVARGGMGDVYEAEDTALHRSVALKLLTGSLATDPVFAERFRREARSAAAVVHRNVVQMHDLGEDGGHLFCAMEYVAGDTVEDLLARDGAMAPGRALDLIRQAAEGLAAAAARGLVHRDVKPSNLLVDGSGTLKLTDFGLARALEGCSRLTHADLIMGTPHYVSPEQARGDAVDERSDQYSLGITLFQMLSDSVPFDAATPMGVMLRHVTDPLPALTNRCPTLPPAVANLVHRMLEKEPSQRFPDYEALIEAIDGARAVVDRNGAAPREQPGERFRPHFTATCGTPREGTSVTGRQVIKPVLVAEDLDATRKKRVTEPTTRPGPSSALLAALPVYVRPSRTWAALATARLGWWPLAVLAVAWWQAGHLVIDLTRVAGTAAAHRWYDAFLLLDVLLILPVYVSQARPAPGGGRLLRAAHVLVLSWVAQLWFPAGSLGILLAFPTPYIAWCGMKTLLLVDESRLARVWLLCLLLFSARCVLAALAAAP